ncbi:MAG: PQQ-binding-like beta-propeller repeat protein [Acidobacteriota bacterium]
MTKPLLRILVSTWLVGIASVTPADDWPQWGGPNRDFQIAGPELADWSDDAPAERWRRTLGEGYAGIAVVGDLLVTQARDGDTEAVVAFDATTGAPRWRVEHPAPKADFSDRHGYGPHTTPAMHDGRVVAVGSDGSVHAIDAAEGRRAWRVDLWAAEDATRHGVGYANSPLIVDGAVLLPVGGEGGALVALDLDDGSTRWRSGSFKNGFASPIRLDMSGRAAVALFAAQSVQAFDAETGTLHWRIDHPNPNGANITTPLVVRDEQAVHGLFLSSGPEKGSRLLRMVDGSAHEAWTTSRFRVFYTNALVLGHRIVGSTGGVGTAMLAAVDVATGEIAWRDRRIGRANLVQVGRSTLALDDEGTLWHLRIADDEVQIVGETQLFDGRSWTGPTVVGSRLYARDREALVAIDLPKVGERAARQAAASR